MPATRTSNSAKDAPGSSKMRFLGESAESDAAAVDPESDKKIPAADIDIVQLRPVDSDTQEGPVRPSVVISRSKKKIIAETG